MILRLHFEAADKPEHLLLAPYFKEEMKKLLPGWKNLVAQSMREELPKLFFSIELFLLNGFR